MKKKFISIAKKAMVWTMAASMLVATPLTASAKGLSDVYKIEDQWGNSVNPDGSLRGEDEGDYGEQSRTGTVTSTATRPLLGEGISKDIASIAIVRDGSNVADIEENIDDVKGSYTLRVTAFKEDGTVATIPADLLNRFTWKSSNTAVATFASMKDREGDERFKTNYMDLRINGGGRATVTVSLDVGIDDLHLSDAINVNITEDAKEIYFDESLLEDAVEGESLVLDDYVRTKPATATDTIQYAIVRNVLTSDDKVDKKKQVTLKNGVLTLKKNSGVLGNTLDKADKTNSFEIIAIGTKVRTTPPQIVPIKKQVPATAAIFKVTPKTDDGVARNVDPEIKVGKTAKYDWVINDDTRNVECEVELKADGSEKTTDRIVSWTSNKATIATATVKGKNEARKGEKADLRAVGAGKAVITVKTSSGKTFKLQAETSGKLTGIDLADVGVAYSGQTLPLQVTQRFDKTDGTKIDDNNDFTDAQLKWSLDSDNAKAKKCATVKNGVLTVQADIAKKMGNDTSEPKIKVVVSHKKKIAVGSTASNGVMTVKSSDITLKQVSVTKIVVNTNANASESERVLGSGDAISGDRVKPFNVTVKDTKTKKYPELTIAAGNTKTYGLYAVAEDSAGNQIENGAKVLGWSVNNAKLAKVKKDDSTGSITGVKRGAPKITISSVVDTNRSKRGQTGYKANYKAVKITLNTTVTEHSKTLSVAMKTKNTAIGIDTVKPKNQNIVFVAGLEKGASTKPADIEWTVNKVKGDTNVKLPTMANGKNGKLVIKKDDNWLKPGDVLLVRAKIAGTNVSASMRVNVVNKSDNPTITIESDATDRLTSASNGKKYTINANPEGWKDFVIKPSLVNQDNQDGTQAEVTYTLSKQDVVRIYYDKDKKTTLIKPINNGQVKITAVTADGAKSNITVVVTDIDWSKPGSVNYSVE